jgi:hypothetical protein
VRKSAIYGAAAIARHAELTRLLLEHGADPNDGVHDAALLAYKLFLFRNADQTLFYSGMQVAYANSNR